MWEPVHEVALSFTRPTDQTVLHVIGKGVVSYANSYYIVSHSITVSHCAGFKCTFHIF